MEEVAGEPLDAWVEGRAGDPDAVLDAFADVLGAVDYLHHRPLPYLHLDLKPDNIIVASSGGRPRPVLIDFGIARRSGRPGLRAYTPPYAAPEQQSGGRVDPATDVHALGHILAEVLPRLSLADDARAALAEVAQRARSTSRRARYADAGQMGLAFRLARRGEAPAPTVWPVVLPRWTWAAAAAAVLMVCLALVALLDRPSIAVTSALERTVEGGEVPTSAAALQVQSLLRDAWRYTIDEQYDAADRSYREAQVLAETVEQDPEAKREMALKFEEVRRQINLFRDTGSATVPTRLDFHEEPDE